jgi:hypothetical protein
LGLLERPLGPARWGYYTTSDLYRAIREGKPHPVRTVIGFGANMLLAHADGARGRQALKELEFYAHADLFMNPTAEMADIMLPVASAFEREGLKIGFETSIGDLVADIPTGRSAGDRCRGRCSRIAIIIAPIHLRTAAKSGRRTCSSVGGKLLVGFAPDSPLEGDGFEPSPSALDSRFSAGFATLGRQSGLHTGSLLDSRQHGLIVSPAEGIQFEVRCPL